VGLIVIGALALVAEGLAVAVLLGFVESLTRLLTHLN
jgi:hypothetical protein